MPNQISELSILLVEDSSDDAELIDQELRRNGLAAMLHRVDSATGLAHALTHVRWDIVLSDHFLPGFSGIEALQQLRAHSAEIPFVVVSGRIGEEEAVAMMKAGADDCVMKDSMARLTPAVRRSVSAVRQLVKARQDQLALDEGQARFKAIVTNMPGMVFEMEFSADGSPRLTSVSVGSRELFHTTPELLQQDPDAIGSRVLPEDLLSFTESRQAAFLQQQDWNWVGRINIAEINEIKWVDLRSKVRRRADLRTCWNGIVFNITRSRVAEIKMRRSHEDLARLTKHVETVKEQERSHIAREIHDELGGTLTAIKLLLSRMEAELAGRKAMQLLQATEDLVDSTIDATRRIATSLRPAMLDLGIVAAIEWQAAEFEKRMNMSCQLTCASREVQLEDKLSIVVFRTFQEALTNIAKHAHATRVEVEFEADQDNASLQIHDNGCGIGTADFDKPQAFGILGMRERARSLGGEASVRRTRNGTAVMLRVPRSGCTNLTNLGDT